MAIITIDTEKDSKESIAHTIDFLKKIINISNEEIQVTTTNTNNLDFFNNGLPSSGPQSFTPKTSANDLLNMFDDDEESKEIKPSKGLTDFSQFMPY